MNIPRNIDTKIRPLVIALNKAGFKTTDSCQGGGHGEFESGEHFQNAYIAFDSAEANENYGPEYVSRKDFPKIRKIVQQYTSVPFRIVNAYYFGTGIDPDAGMYSIIFRHEL